jgi:hypothetical protein
MINFIKTRNLLLPFCLFIFSIVLYTKTLLPGVGFWDTGEFQTVAYTFDVAHPTGYPTYLILGKIFTSVFPFGSIAWRMNLLSAIYVSLGIAILGILFLRITKSSLLAFSLGTLLTITPTIWKVAIIADPHSLHFLFTAVYLLLTYKIVNGKSTKLLPILYLVTGFSIGNHMLSIFFIPSLLLTTFFHAKKINSKLIGTSGLFFLLGISVYLALPAIAMIKPPLTSAYSVATLSGLKRLVLGQDFQGLMASWIKETPKESFIYYFSFIKESLPYFFFIFIPFGTLLQFKKDGKFGLVTLIIFAGTLIFSLRYQNSAIERYFIPAQIMYIIWISYFFSYLKKNINNKFKNNVFCKFLVVIYSLIILFASTVFLIQNFAHIDQSKNTSVEKWTMEVFNNLDNNSVIYSWWSYSTSLWYFQKIDKIRNDVLVVNESSSNWEGQAQNYLGKRPVYFIDKIDLENPNLELKNTGNIYQLVFSETH